MHIFQLIRYYIDRYGIFISQTTTDMFLLSYPATFADVTYRIKRINGFVQVQCFNTMGDTCEAGSVQPFGEPKITQIFRWGLRYLF